LALFLNPAFDRPAAGADVLTAAGAAAAEAEIRTWPGYRPTPLLELPGLAKALGVGRIRYKDEGPRFGLKSFKALGGAYAVFRLLQQEIVRRGGPADVSSAELATGKWRDLVGDVTVITATDGNHGRAVAWGARTFGCRSVIVIHQNVSEGRKRAIEAYGATVERVPGHYDDAVRHAAAEAARQGWFVVSDTSWEGYRTVPVDVMYGYTVLAGEAVQQIAPAAPSHTFIQGGVGAVAAALAARWRQLWGERAPRFVTAEPVRADCLYQSARAGRPTPASGDLETLQAGLACGEVSEIAWPVLQARSAAFMTVDDEEAFRAMRRLAKGEGGDPPIVAGESAVCGLAALAQAMAEPESRAALHLGTDADVLLVGTETDTDPETYRAIVGEDGDAVRARAARTA